MDKMDLTNVAYSAEYQSKREEGIAALIRPENLTNVEHTKEENGYSRTITSYEAYHSGYNLSYSHYKVFAPDGSAAHEYICEYGSSFFCKPITHSNDREYLVYKENLYGYSVLDIKSKEAFRYIPAASWKGGETFIATGISYNPANDIVAVEGCYWACPAGVFLLEIKDPMKLFSRYLDVHSLLGDYDKYDDIDFLGWEGTDILLKGYNIEREPDYFCEEVRIPQEKYMKAMSHI